MRCAAFSSLFFRTLRPYSPLRRRGTARLDVESLTPTTLLRRPNIDGPPPSHLHPRSRTRSILLFLLRRRRRRCRRPLPQPSSTTHPRHRWFRFSRQVRRPRSTPQRRRTLNSSRRMGTRYGVGGRTNVGARRPRHYPRLDGPYFRTQLPPPVRSLRQTRSDESQGYRPPYSSFLRLRTLRRELPQVGQTSYRHWRRKGRSVDEARPRQSGNDNDGRRSRRCGVE